LIVRSGDVTRWRIFSTDPTTDPGGTMRSILLYLLGVPIPIIILIALLYH
jgi:hypothetical protein